MKLARGGLNKLLSKYVKTDLLTLVNVQGLKNAQIKTYNKIYNSYGSKFDWIAFFDADEFLDLAGYLYINEFLSQKRFAEFNCVKINWRVFDDNNLLYIKRRDYSVSRFTNPISICQEQTKSILKTGVNLQINSSHGALDKDPLSQASSSLNSANVKSCDANGSPVPNIRDIMSYINANGNVRLNHYMFKTIQEFINIKMSRGYPTLWANQGKDFLNLNTFFIFNKRTPEKEYYAMNLLKLNEQKNIINRLMFLLKINFFPPNTKIGRILRKIIKAFKKR